MSKSKVNATLKQAAQAFVGSFNQASEHEQQAALVVSHLCVDTLMGYVSDKSSDWVPEEHMSKQAYAFISECKAAWHDAEIKAGKGIVDAKAAKKEGAVKYRISPVVNTNASNLKAIAQALHAGDKVTLVQQVDGKPVKREVKVSSYLRAAGGMSKTKKAAYEIRAAKWPKKFGATREEKTQATETSINGMFERLLAKYDLSPQAAIQLLKLTAQHSSALMGKHSARREFDSAMLEAQDVFINAMAKPQE